MRKETRYRYEKRIKELEDENSELRQYKIICLDVFSEAITNILNGTQISLAYVIEQFRRVFI